VSELDSGEGKVDVERPALDVMGGRRGQELSFSKIDSRMNDTDTSPVDGSRSGSAITSR